MDPTTLEIHTRRLKAYKDENGSSADGGEVQTDLFGNDDSAMIEMVKISKAAGELVKENKQKILAVKGVVKRPQVAREMGVDINDPEAVKAAIAQLEYENQRLMSPTPEPEILHKIKVRAGLETEEETLVDKIAQWYDEVDGYYDKLTPKQKESFNDLIPLDNEKISDIYNSVSVDIQKWLNELYGKDFQPPAPVARAVLPKFIEAIENKTDLKNAMRVEGLGVVDFLWGSVGKWSEKKKRNIDGWGIAHLIERRDLQGIDGKAFACRIPFILELGEIEKSYGSKGNERVNITLGNNSVVLKKESGKNHWVITAFQKEDVESSGSERIDYNNQNPDFSSDNGASMNPQSDNSAQSQGKKSGNVKGGIEAKQVDASPDISEPIDVAEADYRKISEIAQKEFKAKPALLSRVISKSRSILPRTVKFDKSKNRLAGVPSIADIRRYAERAFALPIAAKMRRDNPKFLGVYLSDLQAIRTRGGHTNDIGLLAHELGHHLETILFAGKLSEAETAAARELAAYCVERFGDNAYPQNEHVSEGFAQFISDVITDVNDARARCPQAYALLERALRDNSNAAVVFDNIRQMVALNKNGSAFDRVQANIRRKSDMEKTPFMEKIKGLRRLYRRKLIDSNEGIAELAQEVDRQSPGNGKKFLDMVTNYQGGHIGQSDYSIKNQQLDIDGNVVGKGLEQIMSDNLGAAFDRESFSAYLYARRAGKSDKNFFSKMLDNFFYRIKHRRIIKKQMNNWWFSRKVA